MEVKITDIKALRDKTGAGMMDCKKALSESNGDMEEAIVWLRKKGLAAAAKKAGRVAAEGLTAVSVKGNRAVAIELNSETDFVSKNLQFQSLVREIADIAIDTNNIDELKAIKTSSGKTVEELVTENVSTIGENLNLRRIQSVQINNGFIASYIHNAVADGMGRIAVLVALESEGDQNKLESLGKQIAMHIAAARPIALKQSDVDSSLVEKEKEIFAEQARNSGKPENIIEKMIDGRIRKYYEEVVLLEQVFVIDGKSKIADVVSAFAKDIGASVELVAFARLELGEGIEKEETNFAEEVAATVAGK